jgi:hypothetical protein
MRRRRVTPEKFGALLRGAYRAKEDLEIGDRWQAGVMARVRALGALEARPRFLPAFERLVWKLAPISLCMSAGMVFLLLRLHATAHYDGVQLFARYVEELMLSRLLGG